MTDIVVETLSKAELRQCSDWSQEVLDNLAKNPRPSYTEYEDPDRYYKGYKGETAVHKWLCRLEIPHVWNVRTNGESQLSEFRLPNLGSLEVKTAGKPWARECWSFAAQWDLKDWDILVSCRLGERQGWVHICAWIYKTERNRFRLFEPGGPKPVKKPTMICPHSDMRSIINLGSRLQDYYERYGDHRQQEQGGDGDIVPPVVPVEGHTQA